VVRVAGALDITFLVPNVIGLRVYLKNPLARKSERRLVFESGYAEPDENENRRRIVFLRVKRRSGGTLDTEANENH
jgi:hypothetical protein